MNKENLDYISILKEIPEFANLDPEHLKEIASIIKVRDFPCGSTLFRENDIDYVFYIIVYGEVRIYVTNEENTEITLSILGPRDCFGEIGFITGKPREVSTKVEKDSKLLAVKKDTFDALIELNPSLTKVFMKILARRLITDTESAILQSSRKQELKQFWIEKDTYESFVPKGRSKHVQQLKSFAENAAENNFPVLLIGEKGTGKSALARHICGKSNRKQNGLITLDCSTIPQISTTNTGKNQGTSEILLGLSQESALFGHLMGSLTFTNTKRLGYVEVAEGKTLVIENVEELTLSVQNKLLSYLKTGFYKRIGNNEQIKLNVEMIFTCGADIEGLVKTGYFSKELYKFLIRQSIVLIPLREHKEDINELVVHFIVKYSKIEGKRPIGITKEAMNIFLGYDWPNNIDQLDGVIRRAVSLSDGNTLTASHVFLGPVSTEKKRIRFNLLKFESVRRFISNNLYPDAFRIAATTIYLFVVLVFLFGLNGYEKNTVLLMWAIGWPALIISLFFASRLFCGLCPFRSIAEMVQKIINLKLKLPDFIKKQGPYIGVFGFALILCLEHITDMPNSPLATAGLLLSILVFAVIFSILYESASWCRYVCPLGMMCGVYSKISMIEVRANTSVCNSECNLPTCYTGTNKIEGCPMQLGVFNMHTNENCILCGQCVKNCRHHAIQLNLRVPASELLQASGLDSYRKGANVAIAFFIPVLIAGVTAINFSKLSLYNQFFTKAGSEAAYYAITYISFYILCFGLIWLGSMTLKKSNQEGSSLERLVWYACTFIPIAFAGEIANHIITFINGVGQILPVINLQLSSNKINILNQQTSTEIVKLLQIILIIMGTIASIFIGKKFVKKVTRTQGRNKFWSIYFVNCVFCCLFILVFILRV